MQREMSVEDQLKAGNVRGQSLENARRELENQNRRLKEAEAREQQLKKDLQQARMAVPNDWDAPVPLAGSSAAGAGSSDSGRERAALEKKVAQLEREKNEAAATVTDLQRKLKESDRNAKSPASQGADAEKADGLAAENRKLTAELGRVRDQLAELQHQTESRQAEQQVLSKEVESTDARCRRRPLSLSQELNRERSRSMELQETVTTLRPRWIRRNKAAWNC
jgi:DNA repair exonuclease SbcCD ATPase subunit